MITGTDLSRSEPSRLILLKFFEGPSKRTFSSFFITESNRGSWHMAACTHREATLSLLFHLQLSGKSPDVKCEEGGQDTASTLSAPMAANGRKMQRQDSCNRIRLLHSPYRCLHLRGSHTPFPTTFETRLNADLPTSVEHHREETKQSACHQTRQGYQPLVLIASSKTWYGGILGPEERCAR